jgi:hypothetical protein
MIGIIRLTECKNHYFFSFIKNVLLFILLISFKLEGQYRFDFEIDSSGAAGCCSGNGWVQVPAGCWCCDTVEPVEGTSSLHHCFDHTQEGCDFIVFRHDPLSPEDPFSLSFRIRHAYDPSSQNNWQVALLAGFSDGSETGQQIVGGFKAANQEPSVVSGIVLGVNYEGSDDLVKVWEVKDGEIMELISTTLNYQEQVGTGQAPLFRLDGDGEGGIFLYCDIDPYNQVPELLGYGFPEGIPRGRELVLRHQYTSSRDLGLWFDRLCLEGHFERDTLAPLITWTKFTDGQNLRVGFSERVVKPDPGDFGLTSVETDKIVVPCSVSGGEEGLILHFSEVIPNRVPFQLQAGGIADYDGNLLRDTVVAVLRNDVQLGDLVFNEVMADPDPSVRYDEEYLELYNRSGYSVDPEGWLLKVNDSDFLLAEFMPEPAAMEEVSREIQPGNFCLVKGITLPNDGAMLSLYDGDGRLVHAVSYRVPWDGAEWKQEGGWSLESPDPDQVCRIMALWEYSSDPGGGTPGRINSNCRDMEDREPPVILYTGVGEPGECLLYFSEPVRLPGSGKGAFTMDPGGEEPDTLFFMEPLSGTLKLCFQEDFSRWSRYRLSMSGLSDCAGNISNNREVVAGAVSQPGQGSVVINEIMYDPDEGSPSFVELFLPGEEVYDLQDIAIHMVEEGGSPDNPVALSPHSRLFLPGQYLVLSGCVPQLMEAYTLELSGQWVEVEALSSIKKNSGIIYLTDRAGQVVDRVSYSDRMHMGLLEDPRGVSLERVSAQRAGMDPDNWHSAASIEGYATPGRRNSQTLEGGGSGSLLEVEPEVFSPDNDGYNDLLHMTIASGGSDWVIGLWITDLEGNRIRILANNHLAGPSAAYTWDGEGEDGVMLPMGLYVVHARGYHPSTGERWIRRKAVGLVYR